jgi:hypothetical protein
MRDYHNQILVNNVEFAKQKTTDCILPVLGAYDTSLINPVSRNKCPVYNCKTGQSSCASSHNPNNFDSSNITITLSKGVCLNNQTCALPDQTKIYDKETVNSNCLNKASEKNKFPGETCENNDDCINKNCTSSKTCQYIPLQGNCTVEEPIDFTKQCGVGAFCNATSLQCQNLLSETTECKNTFDCDNDLVCFNKTCSSKYGSFKDGEKIDITLLSEDFGSNYNYLCETMQFDAETNKCYSFTYANKTDMTPNSDGFVPCERSNGKECAYSTSIDKSIFKSCQCGFNDKGQGYCPVDFSGNF